VLQARCLPLELAIGLAMPDERVLRFPESPKNPNLEFVAQRSIIASLEAPNMSFQFPADRRRSPVDPRVAEDDGRSTPTPRSFPAVE
jgi:hypothetical protein